MRAALLAVAVSTRACAGPTTGGDVSATSSATTPPATPSSGAEASATPLGPSGALPAPVASATSSASADPSATAGDGPVAAATPGVAWAQRLGPILFRDINTLMSVPLRLYRDDGSLDEDAAREVERVLWAVKDEEAPRVSRRLLQLVVKAATHFGAGEVVVISSHRGKARKGSKHRSGEAIDFVLSGVDTKKLAEHLRTFARVGVGMYVHPRSQFVHLDVREQSYHWVDGSPPGRTWREHGVTDPSSAARDAAYDPARDLP